MDVITQVIMEKVTVLKNGTRLLGKKGKKNLNS